MKRSLKHIPELDGMRGCAALAVFVLHVCISVEKTAHAAVPRPWEFVLQIVGLGSYGVDIFFVLSGFLITSLLIADRGSKDYFHNFYWKRVLRIQPVYILYLVLTWLLIGGSHGYVLLAMVFIVNFDNRFHVADVGPAWTLSIEEQFYLLWPQVIRRLSIRQIYWTSICLIGASAALRTGMAIFAGHFASRYTFYRFDGLGLGALLACQWMYEGEEQSHMLRSFLKAVNSNVTLGIAITLELLTWAPHNYSLPLLATNYIVYRTIRYILRHPGSRMFGWLGARPLVFLGAISYSVYMFHTIILDLYDSHVAPPTFQITHFLLRAAAVTAVTLLFCTLVRYLVEIPALRLRKYVLEKPVPIAAENR